jgi:hypothetical protein
MCGGSSTNARRCWPRPPDSVNLAARSQRRSRRPGGSATSSSSTGRLPASRRGARGSRSSSGHRSRARDWSRSRACSAPTLCGSGRAGRRTAARSSSTTGRSARRSGRPAATTAAALGRPRSCGGGCRSWRLTARPRPPGMPRYSSGWVRAALRLFVARRSGRFTQRDATGAAGAAVDAACSRPSSLAAPTAARAPPPRAGPAAGVGGPDPLDVGGEDPLLAAGLELVSALRRRGSGDARMPRTPGQLRSDA